MGRTYYDCGYCGETFHIDDEELHYCEKCGYVCDQCCDIDDKGNVTKCESCEKIDLDEVQQKIQIAVKKRLIERTKTLKGMCLKKHEHDVKHIIDEILQFITHDK